MMKAKKVDEATKRDDLKLPTDLADLVLHSRDELFENLRIVYRKILIQGK